MKTFKKKWKEFRCSHCNRLQFKYLIERDVVKIEIKCNSCNTFNHFQVNLEPIFEVLKQLDKLKNENN